MERLRRTVVQLEEAKRFILDGEVALSRYLPMPIGTSLIVVARKDLR